MSATASIASLLPHRPPFRFVDEVLHLAEDHGVFVLHLTADDPRLRQAQLPPLLLLEALAQSTAAFNGATGGGAPQTGLLLQIDAADLCGAAAAGDEVELEVRPTHRLGAMVRFAGEARCGERLLVRATLTVVRQPLDAP